jgi:hypothetical protein
MTGLLETVTGVLLSVRAGLAKAMAKKYITETTTLRTIQKQTFVSFLRERIAE